MGVTRVGLIGLGTMGRVMLGDMDGHDGYKVVAAWDPTPYSREEAQKIVPDVPLLDDPAAVITRDDVDLVYIAGPPTTHYAHCMAAIEAGTAILCEKPLGVDLDDSRRLVAAVEEAGLVNLMNFNHGAARSTAFVEEMKGKGKIGDVTSVDIFIHLHTWPRAFQTQATWLAKREQGGFTREMLSHWTYLTRRLFGEVEIINAAPNYSGAAGDCEQAIVANLTAGGVPVFMRAFVGGKGPVGTEYTIWGDGASIRMNSGGQMLVAKELEWHDAFADSPDAPGADRMRTLDAVRRELSGERTPMPRLADGLAVQEVIEALLTGR